jgi:hypothetical protein
VPGPTVSHEEASREASLRAARLVEVLVPLWQGARRWTAAVVVGLFPLLFIVDERVELPLSPVLPGLALLFLLVLGLPFLLIEVASRRYRRKDAEWQAKRADRFRRSGRTAVIVALVLLGLWFAVGT